MKLYLSNVIDRDSMDVMDVEELNKSLGGIMESKARNWLRSRKWRLDFETKSGDMV